MSESLTTTLVRYHPESAAAALEVMEHAEAAAQLGAWPAEIAARVLERMLPHTAGAVLLALGAVNSSDLLTNIQPRAAVRVLQQLGEEDREAVLGRLTSDAAVALRALAAWPEDSAGGMMDTQVATLREHLSVAEAIEMIRRTPPQSLHYLYVVDAGNHLRGVLVMRDMLLADPARPIRSIMRTQLATLAVDTDRERITDAFEAHRFAVLPVVDEEQHLLGVVRHDAVIEAAADEAYEDMQLMVGAGGGERVLDPVGLVVRRRLPWLLVNLGTAFLASLVVGLFETTIATITALAVLLPIVAGQSGNTGAQSMAVVMRGLAMDEVRPGLRRRVLLKELLGGLVNGAAIALACGLAVWIWDGRLMLAAVIALAMIIAMGAATVAGAAIPMIIAASGRDPAQSASIFLSTFTDVLGFFAFLGLAALASAWLA